MGYERPYYKDRNRRPLLFYVVFGADQGRFQVSGKRHRVDKVPQGLELSILKKPENGAYMEALIGGTLGELLDRDDHSLYEAARKTEQWAVLRGEIQEDADLHYMRNAIGLVQALVESGAAGVLDLQTLTLFPPERWTNTIFAPEFNPCSHVVILASEEKRGELWLHTRGMRKFGRPDVSMENVPEEESGEAAQIINQMIFYGALGAFFSRPVKLHTPQGLSCVVKPELEDDPDNPDFNNSYYRVSWGACEKEYKA